MAGNHGSTSNVEGGLSVVDRVLTAFVTAVGAEVGYANIANHLQETLLVKRDRSEAALERALFEVEQA
jgi:hypothetical protein